MEPEVTDDAGVSNQPSESLETKFEVVKLDMDWTPAKVIYALLVLVLILAFGPMVYNFVSSCIHEAMKLP